LSGPRLLQTLAARDAIAQQASPFRRHFLVHTVEQEDKESLKRGKDGKEDEEDGDDDVFRDEEHEVTKDPRESDGDVNGDVDSEFLLTISLVRFRGSSERLVDLSSDEEEEDSVGRDDQQSRDEEGQESRQIVDDPALSLSSVRDGAVILSRSHTNAKAQRKSPRAKMIPFLEELGLSISSDDHLIEVEGDAERPAKVGNEEEVGEDSHRNTGSFVLRDRIFIGRNEGGETNNNTDTKITNELDRIRSNLGENEESDERHKGARDRNSEEDIGDDISKNVVNVCASRTISRHY